MSGAAGSVTVRTQQAQRRLQGDRHIDLGNSAQVIQAAVDDAFSEWLVGR